jgi:hypothetical protein
MRYIINGTVGFGTKVMWRIDDLENMVEGVGFLVSPFALISTKEAAELFVKVLNQ